MTIVSDDGHKLPDYAVLQYREMKYDLLPNSDEGFVWNDWTDVEIADDL